MTRHTIAQPATPNAPKPIRVQVIERTPLSAAGQRIEIVQESWLVEDRWWTEQPTRRRYWEGITLKGRNIVVFHDLETGGWFTQAA
jgi:hypothetical protein